MVCLIVIIINVCSYHVSQSMDRIWWPGKCSYLLLRHRDGEVTLSDMMKTWVHVSGLPLHTWHPGFPGVMLTSSMRHSALIAGSQSDLPKIGHGHVCLHMLSFEGFPHGASGKESVSHSVVSYSLWPHGLQAARLLCPWNSPGKNTGVGCHALLQDIFPTQGLNPDFLHCRQTLYCQIHQGNLLVVKNSPADAEDVKETGLIPGLRRSPGRGHGNPLQYSCLENSMDRAWRAIVRVSKK